MKTSNIHVSNTVGTYSVGNSLFTYTMSKHVFPTAPSIITIREKKVRKWKHGQQPTAIEENSKKKLTKKNDKIALVNKDVDWW